MTQCQRTLCTVSELNWSVYSQEKITVVATMSGFKAKMHQNPILAGGSALYPAGGTYSAPPEPLVGFKGACIFKGNGWEEW